MRRPRGLTAALLAVALAGACSASLTPEQAQKWIAEGRAQDVVDRIAARQPSGPGDYQSLLAALSALPERRGEDLALLGRVIPQAGPEFSLAAARLAIESDRLGDAENWLRAAHDDSTNHEELAVELNKLLTRLGRYDEAVAQLTPIAGKHPRLLNLVGYNELLAGRHLQAQAFFERSIAEAQKIGRDYAPAHYHLGLTHMALDRTELAHEQFRLAAQANEKHLEGHYYWMGLSRELGREDEAETAQARFAELYRSRMQRKGALAEEFEDGLVPVSRETRIESREKVEAVRFTRTFEAGSELTLALVVPAGSKARFTATASGSTQADVTVLDIVHEVQEGQRERWFPHRLQLPDGAAGAQFTVLFEVRRARRLAWLGGEPPQGAAFSEPRALSAVAGRSADARPNILLISLDTLRADRLGSYGSGRDTSPVLDALAREGVRFTQAEATSNWTLPSHYSMFSGLTTAAHGVLPDLAQVRGYLFPNRRLALRGSGREEMLAEKLRAAGYRTAGITENGWVSAQFGFDQGFDLYRSDLQGSLPRTRAAAIAELEEFGAHGPWFLFVHTYTPHQPYHAPKPFRMRWADAGHVGFAWPQARVPIDEYNRFKLPMFPPTRSDASTFADLYDGQVAWADSLVESLLSFLDEKGLREQTVIAVTSDHGEEIFERGQFDHGDTLYEEVTRIPLIVSAPGRIAGGSVVEGPVSLIDVAPTLLDLAGVQDQLGEGRSLLPLVGSRSERLAFASAIDLDSRPLSTVWSGSLKYIRRGTGEQMAEELYDLARDPGERKNVATARPADLARLRRAWDEHEASAAQIRELLGSGTEELDEETLERLKSLGYAQ